jgi:hypothetical protein
MQLGDRCKVDTEGKQRHMASAAFEITSTNRGVHITRSSSLLIDDDADNVKIALANKVPALYFDPEHPEK